VVDKPVLLYYCRHNDGIGGHARIFTIAERLTERFRVVVLNGGPLPARSNLPGNIDFVQLPPLTADVDSDAVGSAAQTAMQGELAVRGEIILDNYVQLRPSVLLIEAYPFGQPKVADELLPLIEKARQSTSARPRIICSVKDILPGNRFNDYARVDRITALLEEYYDAIIVHSDPLFSRLEEYFQPRKTLATPVYHSGFVVRDRDPLPQSGQREKRILVSAGDGIDGGIMFRAAAEAHRLLWGIEQLPMTIVTGADFPRQEWEELARTARELPGLELQRSVPDLGAEFARVRWAVSHCSYDAAVDVLATGISALLLPGANNDDGHAQADRMQRMSHWRAALALMRRHLNGASLANSVYQLIKFAPAATDFNLDGAEITANIIYELAQSADIRPASLRAQALIGRPQLH